MELGALRHAQGFDAYEILKEYEILGGILFGRAVLAAVEERDRHLGHVDGDGQGRGQAQHHPDDDADDDGACLTVFHCVVSCRTRLTSCWER